MDRVMVEKDLRFIDKGDKQDRRRRELAEWRRDTRGRSNTTPVPTGRGNPYDFSKGTYTLKDAWKETGEKSS
jgi:hypothetical protein